MTLSRRNPVLGILALVLVGLYLGNAPWLVSSSPEERILLAHRGLHQTYSPVGVKRMDCTAIIIDTPIHDFQENTLASIKAAFELGAGMVEIDIHPTTDGEFIVFHDWTLDCRTNGVGVVQRQHTAYLKSLDIGHGYTADGGKTFPFRGKFVGAMPTLGEVLTAFPEESLLINIKGGDVKIAGLLTDYLQSHKNANPKRLSVYGGGANILKFAELNPDIMTLHFKTATVCLVKYLLVGWSGHVPQACHNTYVPVPKNYQWLIWGWPNRFENRLRNVGSKALLMGDYKKGNGNGSINDVESVPEKFGGMVWTNRMDIMGALLTNEGDIAYPPNAVPESEDDLRDY